MHVLVLVDVNDSVKVCPVGGIFEYLEFHRLIPLIDKSNVVFAGV